MDSNRFIERAGRPPRDREVFLDDDLGTLWVHRGTHPSGRWENVGAPKDAQMKGLGCLQFELAPGIMLEGPPPFVLQIVFRTHLGLKETDAKDVVDLIYNVFREAHWRGPAESDNEARPGGVTVTWKDQTEGVQVEDVRPILSQLQDPEFSGYLAVPMSPTKTTFIAVQNALSIEVAEDEKCE